MIIFENVASFKLKLSAKIKLLSIERCCKGGGNENDKVKR